MGCLLSGVPRPARLTWPWLGASRVPGPLGGLGDKPGAPRACPARAGPELQVPTPPLGPARPTWPNFLSIKGEVWERPGRGRWPQRPDRRGGLPGPPPMPLPAGSCRGPERPGLGGGHSPAPGCSKSLPLSSQTVTPSALPPPSRTPCTLRILRLNKLRPTAWQGRGRGLETSRKPHTCPEGRGATRLRTDAREFYSVWGVCAF